MKVDQFLVDLAQHVFAKHDVSAIRRVRKSDNNWIALATGATIVNRIVGTKCGMFHIEKIGDEYFTFLDECNNPKACTVGPSKDMLNEIECNLQDAMSVARNVVFNLLAPGDGATEMAISVGFRPNQGKFLEWKPVLAVADAMEVIPRTLAQNSGGNAIQVLTELLKGANISRYVIGLYQAKQVANTRGVLMEKRV